MTERETKVYCKNCRYLHTEDGAGLLNLHFCHHPNNSVRVSSPYEETVEGKVIGEVNAKNDCALHRYTRGMEIEIEMMERESEAYRIIPAGTEEVNQW